MALFFQVWSLVEALGVLLTNDKAWVSAALEHIRRTFLEPCAGGRLPESSVHVPPEQRRQLTSFDLGKCVGLELSPTVQQLGELLLCLQGEEVREHG